MKAYAGIGSRETPADVLELMGRIAKRLAWKGWTLRSGGAVGADQAFAIGAASAISAPLAAALGRGPCEGRIETYLPWAKFEHEFHGAMSTQLSLIERTQPQREAFTLAKEFHPAWESCSNGARCLHARNVHQILGPDVTAPVLSRFVVCWTKEAAGGGGTGQALRIAKHFEVPIFDLADPDHRARLERFLEGDHS